MNTASAPLVAEAPTSPVSTPSAEIPAVASRPAWPIAILGVPFDHVTIREAIARMDEMIASRQPHYVVTANVDFLVQAHRDVELQRILLDADLVLCDGTPLLWASQWLGNPLPERVAGADLAPHLIRHAAEKGHRLFFLGAGPGVAAEATAKLQREHPGINIVGHYAPPFASLLEMNHEEIARRIREARPDILLVSFGCPKQEKWIAMHHRALGVPVAIGVGATLDFLAGRMKRAPGWMRRSGLEWFFRLAQEPRRLFRRYFDDLVRFLPALVAQWWGLSRRSHAPARPHVVSIPIPQWCGVDAGERLTRHALEQEAAFWQDLPRRGTHCLVDVSKLQSIDGTGVAFLLRWRKEQQLRGRHLMLLAPSAALRRALRTMHLADFFMTAGDAADAARQAETILAQPTVQRDGTTRSLAWCGEIICANVDDVWRMTLDHINAFTTNQATLVIVDLSRLRFIDSSGAALMLRLKKWARERPIEIIFANAQPNVRNVLQLSSLDQLLLEGGQ